ncbi:MAG: glycosyltransferase family 2 protein [Candidatus Peribacteraceae bacterium]|jgi:glycosyltransferase involved in cell wall biosynthesis|nr:glycosyltransferase family 2 protein [Candidatus Peribacteraceae bacterium]MDP7454442.1 glycosyltransferase family 2 protein [Candidatus Peribacteraceae bacterium]MDP7645799.1 glycosyltransferase family 2 protein [Candidatus Peribacteraceae bacterium]
MSLSIVIPAYNEVGVIAQVLRNLISYLSEHAIPANIIVVDDGSTDGTLTQAQMVLGVKVIPHKYNKGYGAAVKTGIRAADTDWVITYDADGQHTPDLVEKLLPELNESNDMVVGKREGYKGPLIRQPGKKVLSLVANHLSEYKIPDLNSGLRAFRRNTFLKYAHLFPNGFSISTTSTVCFLRERLNVSYVPISIQPRTGKSTVKARDAIKTLMLIVRLMMLFSPLRIFLPLTFISGLTAISLLVIELAVHQNVSDSAVALITLTCFLFFFGLLADQVAAVRREIHSS